MKPWILGLLLLTPSIASADLKNPLVFIGEVANGAVAGAPLKVDTAGKLSSGISFTEVSATANVTTTSATDVLMTTMTATPAAGTYLVLFSTWCIHSNGNATISVSFYNNGAQVTNTAMTLIPFVGALSAITQDMPLSINAVLVATGAGAIQVEWHTSTGTATCHQRTMDFVRLL